jgi:ABC-type sugar transport system ATPase subunit
MASTQSNAETLLILSGISKRFGSTQALDDVSLQFSSGQVHALVGENGAGKSTLVKIISGVLKPDEGTVTINGREVVFDGPHAASLAGIHLVHQELALLPHRSVVENIFLGSEQRGVVGLSWSRMAATARDALSRLGLDLDVHQRVGDLSTANQQMVEIARAIFRESRLIILDEPTAALPPADAERLFEVIRQLTAAGTAVIYISHRLDEVKELAHHVTVLKDGRHVVTTAADDLTTEKMIQLMVGRVIDDMFPEARASSLGEPALQVDELIDPPSVYGASLSVLNGEIVGLYGLEGHGQDEVLACIAGAREPVSGALRVHGQVIDWQPVAGMISAGVGFVPEDRKSEGLILEMTSSHNITLPILRCLSRFGLVSGERDRRKAAQAAAAAGVRGELSASVRSLSGGNQQKLVLARWLAAESSILLLNQPTRGVDVGSKSEIYSLIRETCEAQGRAALVVSREIKELQGLCDRILVMSKGRLVAEHRPGDTEEAILSSAVGNAKVAVNE